MSAITPELTPSVRHALVRRLGEIEVPAPGTWSMVHSSHVGLVACRRDGPVQLPLARGCFEIGEHPELTEVTIDIGGESPATLVGVASSVVADRHGFSTWHVDGRLVTTTTTDHVHLTLRYHGVFRRGADAWAWFSGHGQVGGDTRRRRRSTRRSDHRRVVLDLVLRAPAG